MLPRASSCLQISQHARACTCTHANAFLSLRCRQGRLLWTDAIVVRTLPMAKLTDDSTHICATTRPHIFDLARTHAEPRPISSHDSVHIGQPRCAACMGFKVIVDDLVAGAADVNIPDKHGRTPICWARARGRHARSLARSLARAYARGPSTAAGTTSLTCWPRLRHAVGQHDVQATQLRQRCVRTQTNPSAACHGIMVHTGW